MANLALEDGLEDDTRDLFVTVDNPEKHVTAMESYITFRVNTKVRSTMSILMLVSST